MSQLKIKTPPKTAASNRSSTLVSQENKPSIWEREIHFTAPISTADKQTFYELFAVLLDAGLPIIEALQVIAEQTRKKLQKKLYLKLIKRLEEGESLQEALSHEAKYFSVFEVKSIQMGEKSGNLVYILKEVGRFFENRRKIQRKIVQVMSYPLVVILLSVGVVYFMISQVVPMFEDVFKQFDAELPYLTQKILALSAFVKEDGWWVTLSIAIAIFSLFQFRKQIWFRKTASFLVRNLPLFGKLIIKVQVARFAMTMGTLLSSKIKLDEALLLTQEVVPFYPISSQLPQVRREVMEGKAFHVSLAQISVLPLLLQQMVKVGEKTATLDKMFVRLGQTLEQETEQDISSLTSVIEPLLVIFLGLIVGLILISMYLPMFQLSQAISI